MSDIEAKKQRFATFLVERLTSPEAKREWRTNLEAMYGELEGRTLADVLPREALRAGLELAKRPDVYTSLVSKIGTAVHTEAYPRVLAHEATLGSYVPTPAREKIDALLARPNLVNPKLVREVLAQEAMEDLMKDVLFDALKEFNEKVNPFFAEWGIPGIVKKVMPIGSGAVLKSLETVRGEFDKRLDPEIKKFLGVFSKKALDRTAGLMIEKGDSPKFVELRKAVARWLYEQPVGDLTRAVDAEAVGLGREASMLVAAEVARSSRVARDVDASIDAFYARHAGDTMRAIRASYGIDFVPDFDALAEATWPLVERAVRSDVCVSWATEIVGEFLSREG
jgi:hypothetical protein